MKLIDSDALIQRLDKCIGETGLGLEPVMAIRDIKELISLMPTVDAKPVRHGQWVIMRDRTLECSECKSIAPFDADRNGDVVFASEYDYCPWCGAKMDGGENDGKAGH